MSPFDRLHPAVQHHIVNSFGWSGLRPLQQATIEPVLRGEHAVLLAPTAGGKTEAAVFPVFSRMLAEDWQGLSVLYICPIKALLNNLEPRLANYGTLLGRRVGVWHGDVGAARKAKLIAEPPDLLLTTPESLEVMLVSQRVDHRRVFAGLRCVIIDEVHAFAGDDRGWHLMYLLERLTRLAGRELQRLGLSATVGNPEELCEWLAGRCVNPRQVIDPPVEASVTPQVDLDWVGNLRNAAIVISRLHRGEKRLVFCDSRARVEELAYELRGLGVTTFVSHSCLSLTERQAAELAFSQGNDCVIVATSTLELGIDVGDLDRVIQIDAPFRVASFLQRIGRTGRRPGTSRNCLFLVTREDAFLRAVGLLHLWKEGFVEPVKPPPLPLHIFAQQVMALTLQEEGIALDDWQRWLEKPPGLGASSPGMLDHIIHHMRATEVLFSDGGVMSIGRAGERAYGQKHFMELFSVFVSPPQIKVFHGRQELGEVHQLTFALKEEGPTVLTLAGRSWQTKFIDWPRKKAYVEPTKIRGRSQWLSAGQPLSYELCQAIAQALAREELPVPASRRAAELFESLREEFSWVSPTETTLVFDHAGNAAWWTFAGSLANAAIANILDDMANKVTTDNLAIGFIGGVTPDLLVQAIRERVCQGEVPKVPLDESFIAELKFAECLPDDAYRLELRSRYDVAREVAAVRQRQVRVLFDRDE